MTIRKTYNLMASKTAQGLGAGAAAGLPASLPPEPGMDPGMGMDPAVDPMAADPTGGAAGFPAEPASGDGQRFTLGSLAEFIDADPDTAMETLRSKLPNAQVQWAGPDGSQTSTELWSLLEPEDWRTAGDETKGRVLGLIMENLPPEMQANETDGSEDSTVIPATKQTAKIAAAVRNSDAAIRDYALRVASSSGAYNGLSKQAQRASGLPAHVSVMYGPETRTYEPNTGLRLDINQSDVVERNKGWGLRPDDPFSRNNIDYETFWRTHVMDRFYDGWIEDKVLSATDGTETPVPNRMNYAPGQTHMPDRATLIEGELDAVRGRKPFNGLVTAASRGLAKAAQHHGFDNSFEHEKYDHIGGPQRLREYTDEQLRHALKDLNETIEIQEKSRREGGHTPKLGYYHDERHAVLQEMVRRRERLKVSAPAGDPGVPPVTASATDGQKKK